MAIALPLRADDSVRVRWTDVCKAADGHPLVITTSAGDTVAGHCLSISVDEIALTTKDRGVVRVTRAALSRIGMQRTTNDGHQLKTLRTGLHKGLSKGFEWLFSPYAPLGLVAVPATLAWGAVSAPFCLLGDVTQQIAGTQEITVI
jgi:hypothetical protein